MEIEAQVTLTARESAVYTSMVGLALRGDLKGVQQLARSKAGVSLFQKLQRSEETARPPLRVVP